MFNSFIIVHKYLMNIFSSNSTLKLLYRLEITDTTASCNQAMHRRRCSGASLLQRLMQRELGGSFDLQTMEDMLSSSIHQDNYLKVYYFGCILQSIHLKRKALEVIKSNWEALVRMAPHKKLRDYVIMTGIQFKRMRCVDWNDITYGRI